MDHDFHKGGKPGYSYYEIYIEGRNDHHIKTLPYVLILEGLLEKSV